MESKQFEARLFPFKPRLIRYAQSLLKDNDQAQDIVQEVYLKLWSIRDNLDSQKNLEALMMKVTKHLSLNAIRKTQKQREFTPIEGGKELTPFDHLVFEDTRERIAYLINLLPEVQRELIHLKDLEGFGQDEISMITGYDKNYIRVNLSRARKRLRSMYNQLIANEETRRN